MRVLFAPHHFGALLSPDVAARALSAGWRSVRPSDDLLVHPHSDGGPGFLDVVAGTKEVLTVPSVSGEEVPVSVVRVEARQDPWHSVFCQTDSFPIPPSWGAEDFQETSSAAVGRLLSRILDRGARRILLGTDYSPWHDGGAGLLLTLAREFGLPTGGHRLDASGDISSELAELVPRVRAELAGVDIIVASSRQVPLRGLHGAGAELAESPNVSPAQAQAIEARTSDFVNAVDLLVKERESRNLLRSGEVLASRRPYLGAGGGVSFILAALGAQVFPGAWVTGEETGLSPAIAEADLAVTGAGLIAGDELGDGVIADVATRAAAVAIPVVAVGGRIDASRGQLFKAGVHAAYPVIDTSSARPQITAPETTEEALVERGARLAKTWSH